MRKRPCFHDEYLQSFDRANLTLVDTDGRGVARIEGTSVVAGGRRYELDCSIFATGFEFATDYSRRTGYEIHGRGGVSLSEKWRDGVATLFGVQTSGFPNCLIISTSQQAVTANFTHMFLLDNHELSEGALGPLLAGALLVDIPRALFTPLPQIIRGISGRDRRGGDRAEVLARAFENLWSRVAVASGQSTPFGFDRPYLSLFYDGTPLRPGMPVWIANGTDMATSPTAPRAR